MPDPTLPCPKCNGDMQLGYIVDFSYAATLVSQWSPGPPKRFWIDWGKVFRISVPAQRIPIGTYRCQDCGFLESYAHEQYAPQKP